MSLSAGTRLGPYEILALIGAGGMGEVWKARDTRLNRVVAIKRLAPEHVTRFDHEARAIAALNHNNICQIYDLGPDYLVMEFVEGQSPAGPMAADQAVRLGIQIAAALEEAHSHRILHRDLKPGNILVTPKGLAKLLDFGLAMPITDDSNVTKTIGRTVVGSAAYMSPEQAVGKPLDERSDIFSFGTVLYELLSGQRAFPGDTIAQVLSAVLRDDPAPLQAPVALDRIVRRCLAKYPAERFQSATELRVALEAVVEPQDDKPSIAVLPFANMSRDEDQEYFSDGLAEEIINALVKIPGLKVIARTSAFSFKGQNVDIRRVAETLGVANVLEGSVRRSGKRLRVTAQLIAAADGAHVWSERFDREVADVFELQDDIASGIAAALELKLTSRPRARPQFTPKLLAYDAILRARHNRAKATPESLELSRACLQEAIAIDPAYAMAYSELGGCLIDAAGFHALPVAYAMSRARAAIQRALELDQSLPEALTGLGHIAGFYDYDWKEARRLFHIAMAAEHVSVHTRDYYSCYLFATGRVREAIEQEDRALQEDPLNLACRISRALFLLCCDLNAAEADCRRILEIDSNSFIAYNFMATLCMWRGDFFRGLSWAERAFALAPSAAFVRGTYASLLRQTGDLTGAESVLSELGDGSGEGAAIGFLTYHLICGDPDDIADWIEKAIAQRDPLLPFWLPSPRMQPIRESHRWPKIARMMNLPGATSTLELTR